MAISEQKMLQTIYDSLFEAFTSPPPNAQRQGGAQADKTYLILNWPGQQVDPAQFRNPWTPTNPTGTQEAAENFSALVDDAPLLNPIWSPSGRKVSQVYADVVNAKVVPPPEDPKDKAAYDKAWQFLNAAKEIDNDDPPPDKVSVTADSPVYAKYKKAYVAYDKAVTALVNNYFTYDMSKPEDQRKWSLLGPSLQDAVASAFDDLQNAQATKVQDAVSTLAQSSNNQVGRMFKDAAAQFTNLRRAGLVDPNSRYLPSYPFPANWTSADAAGDWSDMTFTSGSLKTSENSDFESIGSSASGGWGLWSGSAGFDKTEGHQSMSKETSDLTARFKYARVTIVRPWLNFLLFGVNGWSTQSYPQVGGLSNGTKNQPTALFPLLPTSFVAVRNLEISAKWGKEDMNAIQKSLSTKASFGWGPFSVSGSYSKSSSSKNFASEFDGTTLSNPGLQIIGWVCSVVPNSPPKSF
jgi:hypothetical protein